MDRLVLRHRPAHGPNFATRRNPRTAMTSPPDLHQHLARILIAAMKDRAAPARLIAVSTASIWPAPSRRQEGPVPPRPGGPGPAPQAWNPPITSGAPAAAAVPLLPHR